MNKEINPFDELSPPELTDKQKKEAESEALAYERLIRGVFGTKEGSRLLGIWMAEWVTEKLINIPQNTNELHLLVKDIEIQNFIKYIYNLCENKLNKG